MAASVFARVARLGIATVGLSVAFAAAGQPAAAPVAGGANDGSVKAATPKPAAAGDAATVQKGRDLFSNWGCNACHTLADANASGHVGPALDGNPNLTKDYVVNRVTNGQGAMPAFGGQMSDEEIATIATYITTVSKKQ